MEKALAPGTGDALLDFHGGNDRVPTRPPRTREGLVQTRPGLEPPLPLGLRRSSAGDAGSTRRLRRAQTVSARSRAGRYRWNDLHIRGKWTRCRKIIPGLSGAHCRARCYRSRAVLAHPMGNFSISHFAGIRIEAGSVDLRYILDLAEIPTFQEMQAAGIVPTPDDPRVVAYLARRPRR